MFVVVISEQETAFGVAPRAIGPFDDYDTAQAFSQTLSGTFESEGIPTSNAAVVRVEEPYPGVVVGEV